MNRLEISRLVSEINQTPHKEEPLRLMATKVRKLENELNIYLKEKGMEYYENHSAQSKLSSFFSSHNYNKVRRQLANIVMGINGHFKIISEK